MLSPRPLAVAGADSIPLDDCANQLVAILRELSSRGLQLVAARDMQTALEGLAAAGEVLADEVRVINLSWEQLPGPRELIDEALDSLAQIALDIWPDWYSAEATGRLDAPALAVSLCQSRARSIKIEGRINAAWLGQAVGSCLAKRPPRVTSLSNAVQAEQLSLILSPLRRVMVLSVVEREQTPGTLLGLARVAEWLVAEADVSVLVLVPPDLGESTELEAISFGKVELATAEPAETEDTGLPTPIRPPRRREDGTSQKPTARLITPLIGRPHPNSTGEQLLWAAICGDPELLPLFECNQRVKLEAAKYIVDLLCRSRKLAVEIDGYYWHSSPEAFCRDRRRDFHFVIAGYLVLRLPHDEVVSDVPAALEQVRALAKVRLTA